MIIKKKTFFARTTINRFSTYNRINCFSFAHIIELLFIIFSTDFINSWTVKFWMILTSSALRSGTTILEPTVNFIYWIHFLVKSKFWSEFVSLFYIQISIFFFSCNAFNCNSAISLAFAIFTYFFSGKSRSLSNWLFSRVRWGGMGIKTGIFEMIIKLFKSNIQQLKNNSWVFTFQQYTSHIHS